MKIANKPRLKSLARRLYAAPLPWSDRHVAATAGQEVLDFVAMVAGIKPAYVTGRGFDDPAWLDHVLAIAEASGLHVVSGPYWHAAEPPEGLPDWYTAPARARLAEGTAHYVTKARDAAARLAALAAGETPTIAEEARLLGFPECCVAAHYATAAALERTQFEMISRRTGGDQAEMRRLVEAGEPILPETDEDRQALAEALQVRPAPYTSLNMCRPCATDPESPGRALAARYAELARAVLGGGSRSRTRAR